MILAGIDIGTNALRLLIAEMRRKGSRVEFRPIREERRITRLGEGMVNSGLLSPPAITRTLRALKEFHAVVAEHPVDDVIAVATSAVREAGNRRLFLDRVREEIGLEAEVISGEEEARRTLKGVRYGLRADDRNILVMDIGGGSTEWMVVTDGEVRGMKTVGIGVVKLADRYLASDPLSEADRHRLIRGIEETIGPVLTSLGSFTRHGENPPISGHRLIGTAGTVTTLAALELRMTVYEAARIQNMSLGLEQIEAWYRTLVGMSLNERRTLAGLEKGREDLIIPGTALLMTAMRLLGMREVIVSDYGLKEGVLIDWFERNIDSHR
ncbi:MAG: Ppx/GppA family phosphatase [Nitrospirae bacterium]|nr:Ppx/GppA family phosphatase [Nitrospirota bacterium]